MQLWTALAAATPTTGATNSAEAQPRAPEYSSRDAFLILAHTDPDSLEALLRQLGRADCDVYVHVDASAHERGIFDRARLRAAVGRARLRILPVHVRVAWGYLSLVRAELALFADALGRPVGSVGGAGKLVFGVGTSGEYARISAGDLGGGPLDPSDSVADSPNSAPTSATDPASPETAPASPETDKIPATRPRYTHLHLLSGQDRFFRGVNAFLAYTSQFPNSSFLELQNGPWAAAKTAERGCAVAAAAGGFGEPGIGSQWASLTRGHAEFLVENAAKILEIFGNVQIPDECYKQVVIGGAFAEAVVVDNLRLVRWGRGNHPKFLEVEDMERAGGSKFLGRKFQTGANDPAAAWAEARSAAEDAAFWAGRGDNFGEISGKVSGKDSGDGSERAVGAVSEGGSEKIPENVSEKTAGSEFGDAPETGAEKLRKRGPSDASARA